MRLKIAARKSDLARLQAYRVAEAIRNEFPDIEVQFQFRASLGDLNLNDPLWKMPEKGVFTEDFLKDLESGEADFVVHSWKDLPTQPREKTIIAATLPRADARDLLLFRRNRIGQCGGHVKILTSSPRRAYNLESFLQEAFPFVAEKIEFLSVRGNIQTRLEKLISQDVDGLIVAKAALDRLLAAKEPEFLEAQKVIRKILSQTRFMVLPLSINPTAAAQGALAIEVNRGRKDLLEILERINCQKTFLAVERERKILAEYGGGCHQKIGISVLKRPYGELKYLRGLTDSGLQLNEKILEEDDFENGHSIARMNECRTGWNESEVFPRDQEDPSFYSRQSIDKSKWDWAEGERFLWVARNEALPEEFSIAPETIVWVAGTMTWKKLAQRGVWVSGTADSLGDVEDPGIQHLVGDTSENIKWVKLTHDRSMTNGDRMGVVPSMPVCATYSLQAKNEVPDLMGRKSFFWTSGSNFDRAVELYPNIVHATHCCGPGLTYRHILSVIGDRARVRMALDIKSWRAQICASKK